MSLIHLNVAKQQGSFSPGHGWQISHEEVRDPSWRLLLNPNLAVVSIASFIKDDEEWGSKRSWRFSSTQTWPWCPSPALSLQESLLSSRVGYKSRQSINRQSVYRLSTYRKMLICRHVDCRLSTVCQYFYSPKLLSLTGPSTSGRTFPNSTKSYGISYPF